MKSFVREILQPSVGIVAATVVALEITRTGAAGAYFFLIAFGAIYMGWLRWREVRGQRKASKARSGAARNTGSR